MLEPGYDADVVLVDLDHMYEVSAEDLHSKTHNCPYDGALLYGKVVTTIKGGKVTFQDRRVSNLHYINGGTHNDEHG